jgi:dihydroorotate dehydrogenase electron transfer subunit
MSEGLPVRVAITEVVVETPTIRTFYFDREFPFVPGQFVMVWVPGVDEIPMALSSGNSVTVQLAGDATRAMFSLGRGDGLGIRGPFGNGFPTEGRMLSIAGGVGAAPLLPLALSGAVETFLLGARTARELLFEKPLGEATRLITATDDGTAGHPGFVTELLGEIRATDFDHICVCGPETMMHGVLRRLDQDGITGRGSFSLHRYMKCGVGLCGSCCIDPSGSRVCTEGPVFSGDTLLGSEFGRYSRDASGGRKYL